MISLIVCSKQGHISEELKNNIAETIGVSYELIVIDNSANKYSISSAYNEGIKRASYDYLCFMHEDVAYHSKDWGQSVIQRLSDRQTGLIGLAGAYYLLPLPSPWFKAKPYAKNLIQSHVDTKRHHKRYVLEEDKDVVCVDGFWFCSRKDIFQKVSFDEKTFTQFHFYDLDISLQIQEQGYTIKVIHDITVAHFSGGSLNRQWLEAAYIFYDKWERIFPITVNQGIKKKPFMKVKAYRDLLYCHNRNHYPVSKKTLRIGWNRLRMNILLSFVLFCFKKLF